MKGWGGQSALLPGLTSSTAHGMVGGYMYRPIAPKPGYELASCALIQSPANALVAVVAPGNSVGPGLLKKVSFIVPYSHLWEYSVLRPGAADLSFMVFLLWECAADLLTPIGTLQVQVQRF